MTNDKNIDNPILVDIREVSEEYFKSSVGFASDKIAHQKLEIEKQPKGDKNEPNNKTVQETEE